MQRVWGQNQENIQGRIMCKMSSRTEADRKGGQCHIMSQTLSGNISMRL